MAAKIRRGDNVQVIVGQGRRQAGKVLRVDRAQEPPVRRGPQHRRSATSARAR